jgi:hypothetical protein
VDHQFNHDPKKKVRRPADTAGGHLSLAAAMIRPTKGVAPAQPFAAGATGVGFLFYLVARYFSQRR